MKILIVAATFFEIKPLLSFLGYRSKKEFVVKSFFFLQKSIDVLITGVGMMHTAFHLGSFLANKKYNLAVNVGIAGSFDKKIKLGEVVNVVEDRIADLGVENGEKFLDVVQMKLVKKNEIFFKINSSGLKELKKVKAITVNKIHGNEKSIKKIVHKYNPQIESMEGAAFFYSCSTYKIPCLQIRAISNYVEKRNKKKWKIPLAVKNLNEMVVKVIKVKNQ